MRSHTPIPTYRNRIENYFRERGEKTGAKVECFDDLFPVVCVRVCTRTHAWVWLRGWMWLLALGPAAADEFTRLRPLYTNPQVPIKNNFDDLLIPEDHVSRSPIDTYYVDDQNVLRTHTR